MKIEIDEKKYYGIKELQKLINKSFETLKMAIVTGRLKATIVEPQQNKYYKSKKKYTKYKILGEDVLYYLDHLENGINIIEEIKELQEQIQMIKDYLKLNPIQNEPTGKGKPADVLE